MSEAKVKNEESLDFKRILPIFIIVLVDLLGLTIIIPLLPLYAVTYGADAFLIGILGAVYPIMQLIGAPLLGGLSDRFGRKPVLVVSQIGTFIGFLLLGIANALPLIFLSRLIDGLTGGNIVVAQAAMTDSTTSKTRAQGLGLIGAAFGLGFTLGPAIAGISLAVSGNNFRVPALIAAMFSFASILLTAFWFKETLPEERRSQAQNDAPSENIVRRIINALKNPLIGGLLILIFLQQLIFGGFEQLFALFTLTRLGMDGAGNAGMFLFIGIIIVVIQGKYIGPLSRKYGERKLIYAGLGLLAAGLLLFAFTPEVPVPWYSRQHLIEELAQSASGGTTSLQIPLPADQQNGWAGFIWLLVAMVPASLGGALLSPSINSLITKRINITQTGGALGVSSALVSLANALTPVTGGAIFQFFGSSAPFILGGGMMGILMLGAIRFIQPGPEDDLPDESTIPAGAH